MKQVNMIVFVTDPEKQDENSLEYQLAAFNYCKVKAVGNAVMMSEIAGLDVVLDRLAESLVKSAKESF